MKKLFIPLLIVLNLLTFYPTYTYCENYYKWVDRDGVTHVTDNPQKIPPEYRSTTKIVKEKDTGFKKYLKNAKKTINENKTFIFYILAALIGLYILNKLMKTLKSKAGIRNKGKYDEILKRSGIDVMTIPQFRAFTKNLLATRGFKITELQSDLDFGIDYIAEKSNSNYLVKVISDNVMTTRTLLNDVLRDTSKYGCDKALFISKNFFSDHAIEFSRSSPCELVDRHTLGQWIGDAKLYK